jgi:hypothetical protein
MTLLGSCLLTQGSMLWLWKVEKPQSLEKGGGLFQTNGEAANHAVFSVLQSHLHLLHAAT